MHGGKTPRGPASVRYKDGKYSKFLPSRMFAQYQAAARDPELMSLSRDIALTDARIIDLMTRVDSGEASDIWREAQAAMTRFRLEQAKNNVDGMMLAITQVERLIGQGVRDYAAWEEIGTLIDQRRRLCEAEQRRVTSAGQCLTAEQALALVGQVVATVKRHIADRQVLQAIALDLERLGHRPPDEDSWAASRN